MGLPPLFDKKRSEANSPFLWKELDLTEYKKTHLQHRWVHYFLPVVGAIWVYKLIR
jgi:hypothetical protein